MNIEQMLCQTLSCQKATKLGMLQTLWSGYGEIARYQLDGKGSSQTVIVKHIAPPRQSTHPHQWDSKLSHRRKMRSYQVELNWYRHYANRCQDRLNLPTLLAAHQDSETQEMLLVMSDLDALGFNMRHMTLTESQLYATIDWLTRFHALFVYENSQGETPFAGLWPIGTYWHLETRPDELAVMAASSLKQAAAAIDARLNQARFKTLVHGDAKVANFCFHRDSDAMGVDGVAALDFQYVGSGVGVKDFIYLLGSCLDERQLSTHYDTACNRYFQTLSMQLSAKWAANEIDELIEEWQALLPFAWADFERFLAGWQPQHHKRTGFSHNMTEQALKALI
ncbi:ecdysteroid 22-kinase family protein [Shewanella sp. cp20]|uniref:ecdysteroid 22-kinase family protein n=1 Tax=Shewanella sp. cp20 TaxID=1521167 RepID=UPI000A8E8820|nr:ecdysteroid 22-kinase family protein [Shewanella sp. cp20]